MRAWLAFWIALLAVPSAVAGWTFGNVVEPDTPQDRTWVWPDADTDPDARPRLYFNGIPFVSGDIPYTPNPAYSWGARVFTPGPEGHRMAPPYSVQAYALFGLWRDCNQDGYVGLGATAIMKYDPALLLDSAVCPEGSIFRYKENVTEYVPIRTGNSPLQGEYGITDKAVAWGDFHLPGEGTTVDCSTGAVPRGTTTSAGGLLRLADCEVGYVVATTINNQVDPDGRKGLRFEDPAHPEKSCESALNARWGLYDHAYPCEGDKPGLLEQGGEPAIRVWDCSRGRGTASVDDPTGVLRQHPINLSLDGQNRDRYLVDEEGHVLGIPALRDEPQVDSSGSWFEGANHAWDGIFVCGGGSKDWQHLGTAPESTDTVGPQYFERAGEAPDPADGKRRADFPMRYGAPGTATSTAPWNGIAHTDVVRGYTWHSVGAVTTPPRYYGNTVRQNLEFEGAIWFTFYARVTDGVAVLAELPSSTVGVYGAEACGTRHSGVHNGWNCDPAAWWEWENGKPYVSPQRRDAYAALPGVSLYNLRDVDCYDGRLHPDAPVYVGLKDLSDEPACPEVGW